MKKLIIIIFPIFLLVVALLIFNQRQEKGELEIAKEVCIKICKEALVNKQDLSNGPCLGNPLENLKDWVCDVAHWPRQEIDNLPENQCSAFREGRAKHFIEVDVNCNFIRAY